MQNPFACLKSRNSKFLYVGEIASSITLYLFYINLAWFAYQLTHSSLTLGLVGFFWNIPFLFMFLFGIFADRNNKKLIIVRTLIFSLIPALAIVLLWYLYHVAVPVLLVLALWYGLCQAFMYPARFGIIREVITDQKDVAPIVGLIVSNNKFSQAIAAILNSALLVIGGEMFGFDGVIILAVVATICFAVLKHTAPSFENQQQHPVKQLKEGFRYVIKSSTLVMVCITGFVGFVMTWAFLFQLPVFVKEHMHGGLHLLNIVFVVSGIGGLLAGLYLSSRKHVRGQGVITTVCLIISGVALITAAYTHNLVLFLIANFLVDAMFIMIATSGNAIVQAIVPEDRIGRVVGIYGMCSIGMVAIGNLVVGSLAHHFNLADVIAVAGLISVLTGVIYLLFLPLLRRKLQAVYQKRELSHEQQPI